METCLYQSIESLPVPPKTDKEYDDTSFTGIPEEVKDAARELAERRDCYPRDVHQEAINELIARVDAGESVSWPQARPRVGQRPFHTRMEKVIMENMRVYAKRCHVKLNIFFLAALRDHLRKHGFDIDV